MQKEKFKTVTEHKYIDDVQKASKLFAKLVDVLNQFSPDCHILKSTGTAAMVKADLLVLVQTKASTIGDFHRTIIGYGVAVNDWCTLWPRRVCSEEIALLSIRL